MGFPCGSVGKESACSAWDPGSIPGSGRCSGEGNGNPLQYSCLENSMDGGAWQLQSVGWQSQTQLSNWHFHFSKSKATRLEFQILFLIFLLARKMGKGGRRSIKGSESRDSWENKNVEVKNQKGKNESNSGIILFIRDFLELVEMFLNWIVF